MIGTRSVGLRHLGRLAREHRILVVLLAAATVIRVLAMIAYRPALWYYGDSGSYITVAHEAIRPQATFAVGYSAFLKIFVPTGTLASVVGVQHLLGLAMAVAIYALLRRRGARQWLAALATVPVLFDSLQLALEHYILVETLGTSLMVAGIVILLWPTKPSALASFVAGGCLIAAWFVRPPLLPVVLILVGYLAIRRVGWRPWLAFVLPVAVPYFTLVLLIGDRASPYTTTYVSFYARVAGFADCERLSLTEAERAICPPAEILGHKPDWYIWVGYSPGNAYSVERANDPVLRQFAIDVIRQQPLDYLRVVGIETAAHFVDGVPVNPEYQCLKELYSFPTVGEPWCHALLASDGFQVPSRTLPAATGLTTALWTYGRLAHTPRLAVLAVYVLVAASAISYLRGRRRERADAPTATGPGRAEVGTTTPGGIIRASVPPGPLVRDAVAVGVLGLAIIVAPTVLFMYEVRYALPSLPLVCLAAGLAGEALLAGRRRRRQPGEPAAAGPAGVPRQRDGAGRPGVPGTPVGSGHERAPGDGD